MDERADRSCESLDPPAGLQRPSSPEATDTGRYLCSSVHTSRTYRACGPSTSTASCQH